MQRTHPVLFIAGLCFFHIQICLAQSNVPTPLIGARIGGNPQGGDTAAAFSIGLRKAGTDEYTTTVRTSEVARITGTVTPLPEHVGLLADIFFVDRANQFFTMRDSNGSFVPWNGRVADLVPYREDVTLQSNLDVELFSGTLGNSGDHRVFLGYMPQGGTLYYTPFPLSLTIMTNSSGAGGSTNVAENMLWVKTGGPPGGIGYDVRMRLDQPSRMYATDIFTGVNISDNNGMNWFSSNAGITVRGGEALDAVPVFTLTVDPNNPANIWVGTRFFRGLFKSSDSGFSWAIKAQGIIENDITFRGITVDPNCPNVIYAAAEIPSKEYAGQNLMGLRFTKSKGVVYKSTNGGDSWTAIWRGDALARYVLVDPRDSNVIYVSTGFFDVEAANADPAILAPGGVGVLKTIDGGQTWTALNQTNGLTDLYIGSLAMNPQDPSNLIAGSSADNGYTRNGQDSGVFVTFNGGVTWTKGVYTSAGNPIRSMWTAVAFAPSDPKIAYAAAPNQFLRSSDSGKTWSVMTGVANGQVSSYGPPGLRAGMPVSLQVDPRNPNRVFQNNYTGGNFLSEDGGVTWTLASKGYTGAQMRAVATDAVTSDLVYATGRPGLFRSTDQGGTWVGLNKQDGSDGLIQTPITIAADPAQSGVMLMADESTGTIFRSTDSGATKTLVFQQAGLYNASSDVSNRHGFKAIVFAPSNPGIVYAGMGYYQDGLNLGLSRPSYGIAKSLDRGVTWAYTNDQTMSGKNVNTIAVDPCNASSAYAGTIESGVLMTANGGQSWAPRNTGLPSLDVRSLVVDPAAPNILYAGLENGGIWQSNDRGGTWTFMGAGVDSQARVRNMVINPRYPDVLYAADPDLGVYRTSDRGAHWIPITKGLTNRSVRALAISRSGEDIWTATNGEGVFRLADSCGMGGSSCGIRLAPSLVCP